MADQRLPVLVAMHTFPQRSHDKARLCTILRR